MSYRDTFRALLHPFFANAAGHIDPGSARDEALTAAASVMAAFKTLRVAANPEGHFDALALNTTLTVTDAIAVWPMMPTFRIYDGRFLIAAQQALASWMEAPLHAAEAEKVELTPDQRTQARARSVVLREAPYGFVIELLRFHGRASDETMPLRLRAALDTEMRT